MDGQPNRVRLRIGDVTRWCHCARRELSGYSTARARVLAQKGSQTNYTHVYTHTRKSCSAWERIRVGKFDLQRRKGARETTDGFKSLT